MAPSRAQRVLQRLAPWWAKAMEAESRAWMSDCSCGHTFSVWDTGGVRFKARGDPRQRMRCPACGEVASRQVAVRPPV